MRFQFLHALFLAGLCVIAVPGVGDAADGPSSKATSRPAPTWKQHVIHNGSKLGNGLHPGDLNGDGKLDYVINFEDNGAIRLIFHPGPGATVKQLGAAWPTADIAKWPSAESSCLGDMDGDGFADVSVAHGDQNPGDRAGVSFVWHPGNHSAAADGGRWLRSQPIPGSVDLGNYLFVRPADVNGDGATDLIAGGRRQGMATSRNFKPTDPIVGLIWIEAPRAKSDRRDVSKWQVHDIDSDLISGHGFDVGDLNGDGRLDVADANADWGDDAASYAVQWYPNPADPKARTSEWQRQEVDRDPKFYTKPGLAIGDLDGDGRNDMVTQLDDRVLWYRAKSAAGNAEPTFERIEIKKPEYAQWRSRPLELADLDGDGQLEIVAGAIHKDGLMPTNKAALFVMRLEGKVPTAGNWQTQVIKWGDTDQNFGDIWTGEKWDNLTFCDVDTDGDVDIVANVEEYEPYSIAWFENPGSLSPRKE